MTYRSSDLTDFHLYEMETLFLRHLRAEDRVARSLAQTGLRLLEFVRRRCEQFSTEREELVDNLRIWQTDARDARSSLAEASASLAEALGCLDEHFSGATLRKKIEEKA